MVFLQVISKPGFYMTTMDVFIGMTLGDPIGKPNIEGFRKWHTTIELLRTKSPSLSLENVLEQSMKQIRDLKNEVKGVYYIDQIALMRKEIALRILLVLIQLLHGSYLLENLSATSIKI